MNVNQFVKEQANSAHNGTILSSDFLPAGMQAPFKSAWGYLDEGGELETHAHPADEIYIVFRGVGLVTVGDSQQEVHNGDVIEIPGNVGHKIKCLGSEPLLWAAIWWDQLAESDK